MLDRKNLRVALIITLAVGMLAVTLAALLCSVKAGLRQDWPLMSMYFVPTVILAYSLFVVFVLTLKIQTCFSRLADIVSEKADSVRAVTTTARNRKAVRMRNRVPRTVVATFTVSSWLVAFYLAMLALIHQDWFKLGVFLAAWALTAVIGTGLLLAFEIDSYSKHLEELISGDKKGEASEEKEQPGQ